jgi:hypothetical protein
VCQEVVARRSLLDSHYQHYYSHSVLDLKTGLRLRSTRDAEAESLTWLGGVPRLLVYMGRMDWAYVHRAGRLLRGVVVRKKVDSIDSFLLPGRHNTIADFVDRILDSSLRVTWTRQVGLGCRGIPLVMTSDYAVETGTVASDDTHLHEAVIYSRASVARTSGSAS